MFRALRELARLFSGNLGGLNPTEGGEVLDGPAVASATSISDMRDTEDGLLRAGVRGRGAPHSAAAPNGLFPAADRQHPLYTALLAAREQCDGRVDNMRIKQDESAVEPFARAHGGRARVKRTRERKG